MAKVFGLFLIAVAVSFSVYFAFSIVKEIVKRVKAKNEQNKK